MGMAVSCSLLVIRDYTCGQGEEPDHFLWLVADSVSEFAMATSMIEFIFNINLFSSKAN